MRNATILTLAGPINPRVASIDDPAPRRPRENIGCHIRARPRVGYGESMGSAEQLRAQSRHVRPPPSRDSGHGGDAPGSQRPPLLSSYSEDDWVALILDDIDGRHPGGALDGSDVVPVLDALAPFPQLREPGPTDLPDAADEIAAEAVGWSQLQRDGVVGDLPEWVQGSLDRLRAASDVAAPAVEGRYLLHLDCRADSVLIDRAGAAWIVDWPWAAVGARWVDGLTYLLDARLRGEAIDAEEVLRDHALFAGVPAQSIDGVLAALTGGFFNKARHPAPQNLPTLRDFQRREAVAGAAWLRERWS